MKSFTEYLTEAKGDSHIYKNGDLVIARTKDGLWEKARFDLSWKGEDSLKVKSIWTADNPDFYGMPTPFKKRVKFYQMVPADDPRFHRKLTGTKNSLASAVVDESTPGITHLYKNGESVLAREKDGVWKDLVFDLSWLGKNELMVNNILKTNDNYYAKDPILGKRNKYYEMVPWSDKRFRILKGTKRSAKEVF